MEAGRELDAAVAAKVMGLDVHEVAEPVYEGYGSVGERTVYVLKDYDGDFTADIPCYSADIGAAWQVVERMRADGYELTMESWASGDFHVKFQRSCREPMGCSVARSVAYAICLAALRAVGHPVERTEPTEAPTRMP